jgi:hypothetical protein
MPTISSFYGIVIRMYHEEHGSPHFHAYYAGESVAVSIETLDIMEGRLPRRALGLVVDWAIEHRAELRENWRRAEAQLPLTRIDPLA